PLIVNLGKEQIIGIFHKPKSDGKHPLIIMVHGFMGNKSGSPSGLFVSLARKLAKSQYCVFRFDFRGSGDSDGDFEGQSIDTELTDLNSVIDFACRNKHVDKNRIALLGHSRGGFLSVIQAAKDPRVKSAVLLAPLVFIKPLWSQSDYTRKLFRGIKKTGSAINYWGFKFTKNLLDTDFRWDNIIEHSKKVKIPVLILHGTHDTSVPVSQARKLYKNLNCKKALKELEATNHIFTQEKDMEKVLDLTRKWFDETI
ncbi:MAG TPA: alpha/beta fold hydrolase, partial [archaeon]|nr:alpha/beta fold hydrolase [archaeon]